MKAMTVIAAIFALGAVTGMAPAQQADPKSAPASAATPAAAPTPDPAAPDAQAAAKEAVAQIEEAIKTRPTDPNLRYYLAHYQMEAGDKQAALATLGQLLDIGVGFLPTPEFFGGLVDDPAYQALYRQYEARLPKVSNGHVLYRHSDRLFLPEGIAAHQSAQGRDVYIASMKTGDIVRVRNGRTPSIFRKGDGAARLGMSVDNGRQRLCGVATNAVFGRDVALINQVECFSLKNGKPAFAIHLPDVRQLNDLTIDPATGIIYVSDSGGGAVWKVSPDRSVVRLIDNIGGANGLALDGKGNLYVAHNTGIARVDLTSGKVDRPRLATPARETVAGIDGLYWYKSSLIGVQNSTNPGRVIKIELDADGGVSRITTLQSHHDRWMREPTTAAIVGDRLLLLATTQVSRIGDDGAIRDAETIEPAVIAEIPLS